MKTRMKILTKIKEGNKKDPHRKYSFTKVLPPLIKFIYEQKDKKDQDSNIYMEGNLPVQPALTHHRHRKDRTGVTSESNESDNKREEAKVKTKISQPVVLKLEQRKSSTYKNLKITAGGELSQVHPFMAEGMKSIRKENSSPFTQRNELLVGSLSVQKQKSDEVSPYNFDENYMMFGGDKYKEVNHIVNNRTNWIRPPRCGTKIC